MGEPESMTRGGVAGEAGAQGFSYKGKTLLSGVDPSGRADRIAEAVDITDRTLYLCPSPLCGYGLECLLARIAQAKDSALLCIEIEPELFNLSMETFPDPLKNHPLLRFAARPIADELCRLIRREWGPRIFTTVRTVRLNGGWQLHPVMYEALERALKKEMALEWSNAMTLTKLGRRYIRNALRNLALLPMCSSLDELSFGRTPVLVLGAGPSLDGTLDGLSAHFGKALHSTEGRSFRIVCVDTCLPALKARGIMPDLAIILESQHWNLEDFIGLSNWKVPIAMDISALPRSGDVLSCGRYLFFTPWAELRIFKRLDAAGLLPETLPPLGSVGLNAVAIALQLSSGTVITAGLDFSYTLDLFHSRSSPGHKARLRRQNRFTGILNADAAFGVTVSAVTSKNGEKVFSNPALYGYRDLFEREFAEFGCSPPQLFDIAGNGLSLGIKALTLETAFDILSATGRTVPKPRHADHDETEVATLAEELKAFAQVEQDRLMLLRGMLTGKTCMDHGALDTLINECDYLWAHFPDCAASNRRPPQAEMEAGTDAAVSFLKRVRVEIDPFLKLWGRAAHSH
ncbi:MAG: DUF115 domain-containing protein [Treponema sp.]|nr:DUF115 domain-containing protein [Treponema sp.]